MSRTPRAADLPLDPQHGGPDGAPLPERLAAQIRALVAAGTLRSGDPLPSTRALAQRLAVARGSVVSAYEQLSAEGYLDARRGGGTRIHAGLTALPRPLAPSPGTVPSTADAAGRGADMIDLRPGAPGDTGLPTPAWRTAWREAAAHPDAGADPLGLPRLREAAAARLRRVRAVPADPSRIVVTAGAREGLRLLLDALSADDAGSRSDTGRRLTVAVESPGYPSLRRVPAALGHRILEVPVDEHGLVPEEIPAGIDVLIATPSHQYPLGGSLPAPRRLAVLERARADGFWVLEDDHTAQWRWEGSPLPALAGLDDPLDPRVVLTTSLSTHLAPAAPIGHLHLPPGLLAPLARMRQALGGPVGPVPQRALAALMERGELERHTQRLRARHRRRLGLLRDALDHAPGLTVQDVPGGLSAVVLTDRPEDQVIAASAERGVLVGPLSGYWSGTPPHPGIVISFAGQDQSLREGLARLTAQT